MQKKTSAHRKPARATKPRRAPLAPPLRVALIVTLTDLRVIQCVTHFAAILGCKCDDVVAGVIADNLPDVVREYENAQKRPGAFASRDAWEHTVEEIRGHELRRLRERSQQ